jgi:hypothetical protein
VGNPALNGGILVNNVGSLEVGVEDTSPKRSLDIKVTKGSAESWVVPLDAP